VSRKSLRIKRVAEKLDCSTQHVRNLIKAGRLKPVNIGLGSRGSLRIERAELSRFLGKPVSSPIGTGETEQDDFDVWYKGQNDDED
jgi:excisionase family DNA binding protein